MSNDNKMPDILYQDSDFIILNKLPNLLSVPGRGPDKQDCLSARVQAQYPEALIVHRLDYDTSGIILMALNKPALVNVHTYSGLSNAMCNISLSQLL